mmetsp:Transcript_48198/g.138678  ORF Transcript_48198/g.138678 Transcript_48198/m.138678 type:complete len:253 (+) Transcript_48198:375-1133(+)
MWPILCDSRSPRLRMVPHLGQIAMPLADPSSSPTCAEGAASVLTSFFMRVVGGCAPADKSQGACFAGCGCSGRLLGARPADCSSLAPRCWPLWHRGPFACWLRWALGGSKASTALEAARRRLAGLICGAKVHSSISSISRSCRNRSIFLRCFSSSCARTSHEAFADAVDLDLISGRKVTPSISRADLSCLRVLVFLTFLAACSTTRACHELKDSAIFCVFALNCGDDITAISRCFISSCASFLFSWTLEKSL